MYGSLVAMTNARITREEAADCFDSIWATSFQRRAFDALCTLLRVTGMPDAGWDVFDEANEAFEDYNWHLAARSDDLSSKSHWRIGLLMYCQACEMSAVHSTLANLLRIQLDQPYHLNPLGSLGRADKKRVFKWYPPSARAKWQKIREMAEEAGRVDLVRLIDSVYNDTIRNAFSHCDYIIAEESFRWTEGGLPGEMPLQHLENLITNAFSFFGAFIGLRNHWLEAIAKNMKRYHKWPNFEVLELLTTDGRLDGFRIHFFERHISPLSEEAGSC